MKRIIALVLLAVSSWGACERAAVASCGDVLMRDLWHRTWTENIALHALNTWWPQFGGYGVWDRNTGPGMFGYAKDEPGVVYRYTSDARNCPSRG